MKNRFLFSVKSVSIFHLLFLLFLSFIIFDFSLAYWYKPAKSLLHNYAASAVSIFIFVALLFLIFVSISLLFKREPAVNLAYSCIVLFPLVLLYLYRIARPNLPPIFPLTVAAAAQIYFFAVLSKDDRSVKISAKKERLVLFLLIISYCVFFSCIGVKKFDAFSLFNAKDFAIYNQTFWNTIHGRFFQNSTYGSNFACHNTPFFWTLVPFYYLAPHPLTLLFLKVLLLALSAIPFYLIAKSILGAEGSIAAVLAYMFFPYLIATSIIPPHEITYAPFFLLFTFYFFVKNRFIPFLAFLLLFLSIKEHVSLVAITLGIYALFSKKNAKMIIAPMLLGAAWLFISLFIIGYFQKIYAPSTEAAWFIAYLKKSPLSYIFAHSNISSFFRFSLLFPMFLSLGAVFPLLSPVSLLGSPEMLINLLSDRPAMLAAPWHYNVVFSCFLVIGALYGIKRTADARWIKYLCINSGKAKSLLCAFVFSSVLIHSHLWTGQLGYNRDLPHVTAAKEALSLLPKKAFVTVPRDLAVHVSDRKRYSLIKEGELGEYVLTDQKSRASLDENALKDYTLIFRKNGIQIHKR
ncbi:MAG: DUF2079 domain-containing protein [Candidatus Omnitrophica bacterium]|nr:DUF2079 domain-containing protein [Candidatus Omnitrophota bacterium]MDD5552519.1 DUF2079 domain-containing protein [Candidatus Omnitrophota bacterium]